MGWQRDRSIRLARLSRLKQSDRMLSIVICGVVLFAHGCTQPNLRVGSVAPAISLERLLQAPPETAGNWDSLKGKVVVLEFWATWCGPCVAAISHLNELADQLKDKPIQFISITDEDSETVESFLKNRPIKAWIGLDTNGSMFKAYGVQGLPHTVVVDENGRIAAISYPTALNEQNLNDLLSGKKTIPQRPQRPQGTQRGYVIAGVDPEDSSGHAVLHHDDYVLIRPTNQEWRGTVRSWGKLTIAGGTVKRAISSAYVRPMTRVVCPASLDEDRYNFVVTLPKRKSDQFEPVFQGALAAAFNLAVRHEQRELDVYVLSVPEGTPPKMREAAGGNYSMNSRGGRLTMVNAEVDALAPFLEGELGKPVINDTNISGRFDFDLKYEADNPEALIESVREQLGLALRSTKREVEVLVVESRRND